MDTNLQLVSYLPHRLLMPLIDYYWIAKANEFFPTNRSVNVWPITMHNLIFFIRDNSYKIDQISHERSMMPNVCMVGMVTQNDQYMLWGKVHWIGVRFKPLGLFRLFNISPGDFVSKNVDFELYGREIKYLFECILEMGSANSIVNCFNQFFLKKLSDFEIKDRKLCGIRHCIESIYRQNGNVLISDLYNQLGLSERGFRKLFINSVGISPKLFSRIVRFNYIFSTMIRQNTPVDLFDMIEQAGYYDQSHFLKEFKSFTGSSFTKFKSNFKEFDELHRRS